MHERDEQSLVPTDGKQGFYRAFPYIESHDSGYLGPLPLRVGCRAIFWRILSLARTPTRKGRGLYKFPWNCNILISCVREAQAHGYQALN
jgi:hypothetical protein